MAEEYDWHPAPNQGSVFKVETRNLGWWVLLAVLISVILHVLMYFVLGAIQRAMPSGPEEGIVWRSQRDAEQMIIDEDRLKELLNEYDEPRDVPQDELPDKPEKLSELDTIDKSLDEFDAMEKLKEETLRMAPVDSAQIFSAEAPTVPKQALDLAADSLNLSVSDVLSQDLNDMRNKLIDSSSRVAESQVVMKLDQAEDLSKGLNTDQFLKDAASKAFGNEGDEFIKGYTSLDGLAAGVAGLKPGQQIKGILPTDILFGYNEFELKEEARLAMMKLAFMIQTNPDAKYIIEGHTDSFGGEQYNQQLSVKRAKAVRDWLTGTLRINTEKVQVVGHGKTKPMVPISGNVEEQALNRRVEIVIKK